MLFIYLHYKNTTYFSFLQTFHQLFSKNLSEIIIIIFKKKKNEPHHHDDVHSEPDISPLISVYINKFNNKDKYYPYTTSPNTTVCKKESAVQ